MSHHTIYIFSNLVAGSSTPHSPKINSHHASENPRRKYHVTQETPRRPSKTSLALFFDSRSRIPRHSLRVRNFQPHFETLNDNLAEDSHTTSEFGLRSIPCNDPPITRNGTSKTEPHSLIFITPVSSDTVPEAGARKRNPRDRQRKISSKMNSISQRQKKLKKILKK